MVEAPLIIREPSRSDAPALVGLLTEMGFPASEAEVAERLEAFQRSGEKAWVAVQGDQTLGLITVHITPVLHRPTPVGRVMILVIADGYRGQGLGRALMTTAEEYLAGAGCGLIEVTSNRVLVKAHAFYTKLGYELSSYRFRKEMPSVNVKTAKSSSN